MRVHVRVCVHVCLSVQCNLRSFYKILLVISYVLEVLNLTSWFKRDPVLLTTPSQPNTSRSSLAYHLKEALLFFVGIFFSSKYTIMIDYKLIVIALFLLQRSDWFWEASMDILV